MIITISGTPGSGKGTFAKRLGETLGVRVISVGDLRRAMARERGLSLEQLNALGHDDVSTDRPVDEQTIAIGKGTEDCIVEGRIAYHFIPDSIKIFLSCSLSEAAHRIVGDMIAGKRQEERDGPVTVEHLQKELQQRMDSDTLRYRKHYGIQNIFDPQQYDLVLDSTGKTPEEVFQSAWGYISKRWKK